MSSSSFHSFTPVNLLISNSQAARMEHAKDAHVPGEQH